MRILVTGAAGQLGAAIVREFAAGHDVFGYSHRQLDITDTAAVLATITSTRPAALINCAAYNDVDGAEDAVLTALDVNAFAVQVLARAARLVGATLVHYSTDFVFAGTSTRPYVEADEPNPKGVYAISKLLGEWFACDAPAHYVLRVESLFGGSSTRGSTAKIIEAIRGGREARVFMDRTVSPSYVVDVAAATRALLERGAPCGLYHCVNSGRATWYEVAGEAARLLGCAPRLTPISVHEARLRAPRPQFSALSNAKLVALGITMPAWQDALSRHIALQRSSTESANAT